MCEKQPKTGCEPVEKIHFFPEYIAEIQIWHKVMGSSSPSQLRIKLEISAADVAVT